MPFVTFRFFNPVSDYNKDLLEAFVSQDIPIHEFAARVCGRKKRFLIRKTIRNTGNLADWEDS